MSHLREAIEEEARRLEGLEAAARKLQNQNFADIVVAARRRVVQLAQHPDLDAVERVLAEGERPVADDAPIRALGETNETYAARIEAWRASHGGGPTPSGPFPAAPSGPFPGAVRDEEARRLAAEDAKRDYGD